MTQLEPGSHYWSAQQSGVLPTELQGGLRSKVNEVKIKYAWENNVGTNMT